MSTTSDPKSPVEATSGLSLEDASSGTERDAAVNVVRVRRGLKADKAAFARCN